MSNCLNRREFFEIAGAGLLVVASAPRSEAQRGGGTLEARLHIAEDGSISLLTGKIEEGQGALTELTMAAAEELRVPLDRVRLVMGDTDRSPNDGNTCRQHHHAADHAAGAESSGGGARLVAGRGQPSVGGG